MTGERAPWIIGGAIVIAGLLIAIAVFLSRSDGSSDAAGLLPAPAVAASPSPKVDVSLLDAKAQHTLRAALQAAGDRRGVDTGYTDAHAFQLGKDVPQFTFLPSVRASTAPEEVSMANSGSSWAGAVLSDSGTCFWIRDVIDQDTGSTTTTYGAGEPCTASVALASANQEDWPDTVPA